MIDLPYELKRRWGHLRFIRKRGKNWVSECPQCRDDGHSSNDDPDRFTMFDAEPGKNQRGWCRACGFFDWADGDRAESKPTPAEIQAAQEERLRLAQAEIKRLQGIIRWLSGEAFWIKAHDNMTPAQRRLWEGKVPGWCIDIHRLGYFPDALEIEGPDRERFYIHGDSLSIPFLDGGLAPENIQTLQLRLEHPDKGGRYRLMSGLAGSRKLFFPWPEDNTLSGDDGRVVVVVEGAKKAMWLYDLFAATDSGLTYKDRPVTIVALATKYLENSLVPEFAQASVVWMLDPDAYVPTTTPQGKVLEPTVVTNAGKVKRSRMVRLPGKVDDLIVAGTLKASHIQSIVNMAEPVV